MKNGGPCGITAWLALGDSASRVDGSGDNMYGSRLTGLMKVGGELAGEWNFS